MKQWITYYAIYTGVSIALAIIGATIAGVVILIKERNEKKLIERNKKWKKLNLT